MKKKFLTFLLALTAMPVCAFGFVACDETGNSSSDDGDSAITHEHSWGEGVEQKGATCIMAGSKQFTCACGETRTEEIPVLPHRYDTQTAEWKWNGYDEASVSVLCLSCERDYSLDASVESEEIDKVSCTENGKVQYTATVSIGKEIVGDVVEETVEALGHSYGEDGSCGNCGIPSVSVGLKYELNADGQSYSVVGIGECTDTVLRVPREYEGIPVTAIAPNAFYENADITEVIIAEGIEEIGSYAFAGCYKMKKISIPSTIEHIGGSAFKDGIGGAGSHNQYNGVKYLGNEENPYLVAKSVSSSNQYDEKISLHEDTKIILDHAFESCSMKTVEFPSSLAEIGSYAYYKCKNLKTLVLPANVLRVGYGAFRACGLQTIKVVGKDTVFEEEVFRACGGLTDLEMPFAGLSKEKGGMIYLFDGNGGGTSMSGEGKAYPDSLKNIVVNHNVIRDGAFHNLTSVESVKICSEEPTTLGETPFSSCSALTTVEVPSTLVSVEGGLFQNCYAIVPTVKDGGYYLGNEKNPYVLLYDVEDNKITDFTVDEHTKVIVGAFNQCYSLQSVTLPTGLKQIGKMSFKDCRALTTVVIPESVISIVGYAFQWCDNLTRVYYEGTRSDWAKISIGTGNEDLTEATRCYYVENEADVPTDNWYYWHYVNGVPTMW